MADHDVSSELQLRYVLPFEAAPLEMRRLRQEAAGLLELWALESLVEEVQLVVTELATNVLHHVGAGALAALVLELRDGRLCIEVHDQSHAIPLVTGVECGAECGRGLHLVAALVAEWGTLLTASGKAVWCELEVPDAQFISGIRRASAILQTYQDHRGRPLLFAVKAPTGLAQPAVELIADLLHWAAARGCDPDDLLDQAVVRYEAGAA
ncbi:MULTISPECIES: ATP-binding protein [unclassified Streptomyces]|uniref:ATP-binding protein n=1 Tax=unclassified Streptomyces TaxID=2593676 RepID=UPI00278BBB89|nr:MULTISPECIES: ATP-binding protein [unclassified Streptomyces]